MNPESWTKMGRPYFTQNPAAGVYGPGHASFTQSPDGRDDWLFYHAWDVPDPHARPPGSGEGRSPRLQPIRWTDTGEPDLGRPASV